MSARRDRTNNRRAIDTATQIVEDSYQVAQNVIFSGIKKKFGLTPTPDGTVQAGSFHLTPTGIDINSLSVDIQQSEWKKLGEMLVQLDGSIQWLIGDWLLIGEHAFQYGDVTTLANEFGFDVDRFYDMKSVARAIPYPNRVRGVSYTHHRIVRNLEDRHAWLLKTRQHSWSVAELRKQIKANQPRLPARAQPILTSNEYHQSFNRIMNRIADEKTIPPEDIQRLEQWLEQVKLLNRYT